MPMQPGRAALACGVTGCQNYLAWRYCLLLFFVGSLTSWSAVNNAAILAEVPLLLQNRVAVATKPTFNQT